MNKNNSLSIICLVFGLFNCYFSQTPNLHWAKNLGGSSSDIGSSIVTDESGNVYTIGTFSGTSDFDPGPNTFTLTASGTDIFITKLDPNGLFLWAKHFGGNLNERGLSIALDKAGNVFSTGVFQGTADFDPGPAVYNLSSLYSGQFILKLNPLGNFIWAKAITGSVIFGMSIAVDKDGNNFTTGYFNGTLDFDPGVGTFTLSSGNGPGAFISKLDFNGNLIWAKALSSVNNTSGCFGHGITFDHLKNVYTTGHFQGTIDFDPGTGTQNITSTGSSDVYVSKLDHQGNFLWTKSMGGVASDYARSIKVDATGSAYSCGYFAGTSDFDPGVNTFTLFGGTGSSYISKLDPSGNFAWAKILGIGGAAYSLALDKAGNVYTTGYFAGTTDFDPGVGAYTLSVTGGKDAYISKLDASGNFLWAGRLGGNLEVTGNSITVDDKGSIYATGEFKGIADFNPDTSSFNLLSAGNFDAFMIKLWQCETPSSPVDITPNNKKFVCENKGTIVSVNSGGTVYWYSSAVSTLQIGSGTSYYTPNLNIGIHTYYAEAYTCTNSAVRIAITVTVSSCQSIADENSYDVNHFTIYPNPAPESAIIELPGVYPEIKIELYNLLGQKINFNWSADQNKIIIQRQNINPGIYTIRFFIDGKIADGKVIFSENR